MVYEHFLSKIIYVTDKRVKIEEKLAVKKSKGVFYTPQYIVDYIVDNTVGKKLEGKNYKNIDLKVCDIACGSGAFLLGAYDFCLNWYLDQYANVENIKKSLKDNKIYKKEDNGICQYFLTFSERKKS